MSKTIDKESLLDYLLIRDRIDRYTDAVNRRDWSAIEDLFVAEDGTWDVGGSEGPGGEFCFFFKGAQNVANGIAEVVGTTELCFQENQSIVIDVDGDRATARCGIREAVRMLDGETSSQLLGIYFDDLVRCEDGQWRFSIRRFRFVYHDTTSPLPGRLYPLPRSEGKTA